LAVTLAAGEVEKVVVHQEMAAAQTVYRTRWKMVVWFPRSAGKWF
jgi:hypothetical protein